MTFQLRPAERKQAKLKLGVSGPSGSGKTYSALLMACGMVKGDWKRIALIDTENGSGELYSSLGPYNVLPFSPPFSPQRYVEAIRACDTAEIDVIIVDSVSHEWDGVGGCLKMHEELGGKYQDWARVTPKHQAFVNALLQIRKHVIVTTRKKQDYQMVQESGAKAKVQKLGLKEIQREGFEYELTINFDVEMNHYAQASKDRTGVFMPRGVFQISKETGQELLDWANSGKAEELAAAPSTPVAPHQVTDALEHEDIPDPPSTAKAPASRFQAHLANSTKSAAPGDYIARIGKANGGVFNKAIKNIDRATLVSTIDWLETDSKKTGRPIGPLAEEFIRKASEFIMGVGEE